MTDYTLMAEQLKLFAEEDPFYVPLLSNAAAILWENMRDINWAGFYLMRGDQLVLGPFQGKVACIHIAVGKGVCGTAVAEDKTQVIPDVHRFKGHIACDSASRSEIVVPLHQNGQIIGVIDIDAPMTERFNEADAEGLQKFADVLEAMLQFS